MLPRGNLTFELPLLDVCGTAKAVMLLPADPLLDTRVALSMRGALVAGAACARCVITALLTLDVGSIAIGSPH